MFNNQARSFTVKLVALLLAFIVPSCSSKIQIKKERKDNIEIVTSIKGEKTLYRLIYTYDGNRKIKGEYWESIKKKKKKKKESKRNILAGTSIAKKFEKHLADRKVIDESDIKLNIEKDGFILKFVKKVIYNKKGLPKKVIARGFTSYPVLGIFNLKTDREYSYNDEGKLIKIIEKNINVDTLLLNFGIGNITEIERDSQSRPIKVSKKIGSIPPAFEETKYIYFGNTPNIKRTGYQKAGIDMKTFKIVPVETITILYSNDIPWEGKKKYSFSFGKTIRGITIYDEVKRKQKLDGSQFMKMSKIDQAFFLKDIYDILKNERKGPMWRIGELPDVPEPFLIYGDQTWW